MIRWALVAAIAATVLAPLGVAAQESAAGYPLADGYVLDASDALSAQTESALEEELRADEARTTNQVAVAVIPTLGGRTVEEYATGLFNAWGVGQASQDNGVLVLVATEDRKLRIEVGAGLLDELPDQTAASVVQQEIVPRLRAGDIEGGVRAGTIGVRRALGDDVATPDSGATAQPASVESAEPAPGFDTPASDAFLRANDDYPDGGFDFASLLVLVVPLAAVGFGLTRLVGGRDSCPSCARALSWGGSARRGAVDRCETCGFARQRVGGLFGAGAGLGFGGGLTSGGSTSSSSGSSFGGGSSGGGGASGSW